MCISKSLKIMGVVVIALALGLVQVTFTTLTIKGVIPNLVLILLLGVSFLEIREKAKPGWKSFSVAFGGGLLLDVFSSLPLGTEALMMVVVILIIEQVFRFLDKANVLIYVILTGFLLVLYQVGFHLLSFGEFDFNWVALVYNFSLALLFYFSCFLVIILGEK